MKPRNNGLSEYYFNLVKENIAMNFLYIGFFCPQRNVEKSHSNSDVLTDKHRKCISKYLLKFIVFTYFLAFSWIPNKNGKDFPWKKIGNQNLPNHKLVTKQSNSSFTQKLTMYQSRKITRTLLHMWRTLKILLNFFFY